ncbi:MAG: restriction endonuclease subunit S [Pyrinomonadaceae bacterium]
MADWKELKLGDVITFQRGHDLPRTQMIDGEFPVAGSNGIIGYHNKFTTKAPGVTIGRSGNIGTPHFYLSDYWAHNTVLYIKDFKGSEPKFIYYFLKKFDFSQFNAGSAVPTLNRNHIHEIEILLPPLPEQQAIAEVLSSLDDKIDLLHRQNKTLEAMAETLFRQWFVEEAE